MRFRSIKSLRLSALLALALGIWSAPTAYGQKAKLRKLDFSWDAVPGAKGYDLELGPTIGGKAKLVQTPKTSWSGELIPGTYKLRVRALDKRGVPGKWSDAFPVVLPYPAVSATAPSSNQLLKTSDKVDRAPVTFRWEPVGPDVTYRVTVAGQFTAQKFEKEVDDAEIEMDLPVADRYAWSVVALSEGQPGDVSETPQSFVLEGPPLETPELGKSFDPAQKTLSWKRPQRASAYQVQVQVKRKRAKGWETLLTDDNYTDDSLKLQGGWPTGKYRVKVLARAPLRAMSKPASFDFDYGMTKAAPAKTQVSADRPGKIGYSYAPFLTRTSVEGETLRTNVSAAVSRSHRMEASYRLGSRTHAVGGKVQLHLAKWQFFRKNADEVSIDQRPLDQDTTALSMDLFYRYARGPFDGALLGGIGNRQTVLLYAMTPTTMGSTRAEFAEGRAGLNLGFSPRQTLRFELSAFTGKELKAIPKDAHQLSHAALGLGLSHPFFWQALRLHYSLGLELESYDYVSPVDGKENKGTGRMAHGGIGMAWHF